MLRERVFATQDRLRRELAVALAEDHTDREIAASFAIGTFITAMPTGGLGIGLFVVLAYVFTWISKTAIFASVLVLNPIVKPVVYVASYQLGAGVFGTEPVVTLDRPLADAVVRTIQFVLIGNVVIAFVLSGLGYLGALRIVRLNRRREDVDGSSRLSSLLDRFRGR